MSEFGETQFEEKEVKQVVFQLLSEQPFVTTKHVAEKIGSSRETARQKLNDLVDKGVLRASKVGGRSKVWYPDDFVVPDSVATKQTGESDESASKQNHMKAQSASEQDGDEIVSFFPSRRELVIVNISDRTKRILAQVGHLVDSTESSRMYKIDETDVWNAPYDTFENFRDDVKSIVGDGAWSPSFESRLRDDWDRANMFRLRTKRSGGSQYTVLEADDADVFENIAKRKLEHNTHYTSYESDTSMRVTRGSEAGVKETLYDEGYPVSDERDLESGASLSLSLSDDITLRDYQKDWVETFMERRSGVFVGPSGSGKTVAGIGVMERIGGETLIITPKRAIAQQWEDELVEKTSLPRRKIGQYHGGEKNIRPVTITTYDTAARSRHRRIFQERDWGLVIADECHRSVATTWKRFRKIQSKARLGLTATPVREQGDAKEVYTLIGPPVGTDWGKLFTQGWVEKPNVEVRLVPWGSDHERERYRNAEGNVKMIEAAKNSRKIEEISTLLEKHEGQKTLIFTDWIDQGEKLSKELDIPFVYGDVSHAKRQELYDELRSGERSKLIVSRVADEGIDLPDVEVAILASTMGSSRSQTGQRTGRTMRPLGEAQVYIILTKGSNEQDWGRESTQYLAQKGITVSKNDVQS